MWWLYSDQARSASVRGASGSSNGSASCGGEASAGQRGANCPATSAGVARSATTSTAGGSEVSDAAANSTVTPTPSSTSTKRRRRTARGARRGPSGARARSSARPSAERARQERALGEHHDAVSGPDQSARVADVATRARSRGPSTSAVAPMASALLENARDHGRRRDREPAPGDWRRTTGPAKPSRCRRPPTTPPRRPDAAPSERPSAARGPRAGSPRGTATPATRVASAKRGDERPTRDRAAGPARASERERASTAASAIRARPARPKVGGERNAATGQRPCSSGERPGMHDQQDHRARDGEAARRRRRSGRARSPSERSIMWSRESGRSTARANTAPPAAATPLRPRPRRRRR